MPPVLQKASLAPSPIRTDVAVPLNMDHTAPPPSPTRTVTHSFAPELLLLLKTHPPRQPETNMFPSRPPYLVRSELLLPTLTSLKGYRLSTPTLPRLLTPNHPNLHLTLPPTPLPPKLIQFLLPTILLTSNNSRSSLLFDLQIPIHNLKSTLIPSFLLSFKH